MIQALLYLIPAVIVFKICKHYYVSVLTVNHRYKLIRLRDKLRYSAIINKSDVNDKFYKYLEGSISKSHFLLDKINFWVLFYYSLRHREEDFDKDVDFIKTNLDKKDELNKIYEEYLEIASNYIVRKSILSIVCLSPLVRLLDKYILSKQKDRNTEDNDSAIAHYSTYMTVLPETSVSYLVLS